MEVNLVTEGFKFMILGMSIVFVFLYVMVLVLKLQSKIITKYFPEPKALDSASTDNKAKDHKKVVAAITAAIEHHRSSK